jgi:hypothetical protein
MGKDSKGERLCRLIALQFNKDVFFNVRPDFLMRETGHNLELDIYWPDLNLAVEYQGKKHFTDKEQIMRDNEKRQKCKVWGIELVEISHPICLIKTLRKRGLKKLPVSLFKSCKSYYRVPKVRSVQKNVWKNFIKVKRISRGRLQTILKLQQDEIEKNRERIMRRKECL